MSEKTLSVNKNWKKLLSLVLSAALVSSLLPQGVYAEPEETVSQNEYEEENGGENSVLFSRYSDKAAYIVSDDSVPEEDEDAPTQDSAEENSTEQNRNSIGSMRLGSTPASDGTIVLRKTGSLYRRLESCFRQRT